MLNWLQALIRYIADHSVIIAAIRHELAGPLDVAQLGYTINPLRYDLATGRPRDPGWEAAAKQQVRDHPECEACGGTVDLEAHHEKNFAYFPELEMDPANRYTLCGEGGNACHRIVGHGGDFRAYVPGNRAEAKRRRAYRATRRYSR